MLQPTLIFERLEAAILRASGQFREQALSAGPW
jgi:hypothetical protein